jgi:hypothetical protein
MNLTNNQIDRMRYELEHPEIMKAQANIIKMAKENIKAEGKNFKEEFKKYLKNKGYSNMAILTLLTIGIGDNISLLGG